MSPGNISFYLHSQAVRIGSPSTNLEAKGLMAHVDKACGQLKGYKIYE